MIKHILKNKWIILSLIFIFFTSWINISPNGYIVAGGDVFQVINFSQFFIQYNYVWSNISGEGIFLQSYSYIFYYFLIAAASAVFQLTSASQSFLYYFFFFAGSFFSFYMSLLLFNKKGKKHKLWKVLFSFAYTFNMFTFQNFYSTLGFSPFNLLYVFLPIIFALTYRYFTSYTKNYLWLSLLAIAFFGTNVINGNLPFFIALVLFLCLFIIGIFFLNYGWGNLRAFFTNVVLFFIVYFLSVCWSVIPQVIEMLRLINVFETDSITFDLDSWILWQAVRLPSPFFITFNVNAIAHNVVMLYAQLSLFIVFIFSFLINKKKNSLSLLFLVMVLLSLFLLNKGIGIIPTFLISEIFSNPILGALRSHEKIIIFLPFFLLLTIYLNLNVNIKSHRYLVSILLIAALIISHPLLSGKMQTEYSASHKQHENYINAEYSYLNKIPQDYYTVANLLNSNSYDYKIIRMPYNVINSPNWANFPQWKHVGIDPTLQLFNNPTIQMIQYGTFGKWNYGLIWNKQGTEESKWILPFAGMLSSKYIIYHKDVDKKFIKQTQEKIHYYEKEKLIKKIYTGSSIDLYEIDKEFYLPHLYTTNALVISDKKNSHLPSILSEPNYTSRSAVILTNQNKDKDFTIARGSSEVVTEYKKINPTRYRVIFHNVTKDFVFVLNELFHNGWKLYAISETLQNHKSNLKNIKDYQTFEKDQATKDDVVNFINKSYISSDLKGRSTHFISKDIKGTIQNNNMDNGKSYDTWFKKSVDEKYHIVANGYANAWVVQPKEICSQQKIVCQRNKNGSYTVEMLIDFYPQHLYNITLVISSITFVGALMFLIYSIVKRKT